MTLYRLKRRNFLIGLGGLSGLRLMLGNIEAVAAGTPPPPRLLLVHWPGGTVHFDFIPQGTGTSYVASPILQPFEDAGLREDLIALYGTNVNVGTGNGGAAEAGTVMMTTGTPCPGTRQNGGEYDDAVAGGPSFEQIFLKHVPGLRRPDLGSVNMTCDARVDSQETSTQCLSYSYETREIESARPGGLITEHLPQMPDLSPLDTYTKLFSGFMPGTSDEEAIRNLTLRKSVLDSALNELGRLGQLVPAAEREKIDVHTAAIRRMEQELSDALAQPAGGSCGVPDAPDGSLIAPTGSSSDYANPKAEVADDPRLSQMGQAYFAIVRAAFQCDLIRVATFQWCTSTNHTAFQGLYPGDPEGAYMHHPLGSSVVNRNDLFSPPPAGTTAEIVAFLSNVHTWFNRELATALVQFKQAEDVFGGSLLDSTVVPMMTEKAEMTDSFSPMPSLIIGGRGRGLLGGQYHATDGARPHNDVWMTVAQALLGSPDPLALLSDEVFFKEGVSPIAGLWQAPA